MRLLLLDTNVTLWGRVLLYYMLRHMIFSKTHAFYPQANGIYSSSFTFSLSIHITSIPRCRDFVLQIKVNRTGAGRGVCI